MVLGSIPKWLKTLAYALAISTGFELLYYLKKCKESENEKKAKDNEVEVIFFPDKTVACDAYFSYGCSNASCWLAHEETSTMKLKAFLSNTEKLLDICVYCIASDILVDEVLKLHDQGVIVRVITDQAQALELGVQVGRLRAAGIEVRTNATNFFMHHKFAISDGVKVMTGSFNWSGNAMLGNNENVVFIKNRVVTDEYKKVFEHLWEKYKPYVNE